MKKYFDEEGWELRCGPCDPNTKKPNAGVGIAVKKCHHNSIKLIPTKIHTESFNETYLGGRAAKYQIDMGWGRNLQIFVVYGMTGDSGESKLATNAIIDTIREEE